MSADAQVFHILEAQSPGATAAVIGEAAGGSTPAEQVSFFAFDSGADEYMDYKCFLDYNYADGGLKLRAGIKAATAITGVVRLSFAIRAFVDDTEDLDSAHTYVFTDLDLTAPDPLGATRYGDVTLTDGTNMDNLSSGEWCILRVMRDVSVGSNMAGDARLVLLTAREAT